MPRHGIMLFLHFSAIIDNLHTILGYYAKSQDNRTITNGFLI